MTPYARERSVKAFFRLRANVWIPLDQALLEEMCIPLDKHQLKALMEEIDTDGSGEVDFDEASPLIYPERLYPTIVGSKVIIIVSFSCTVQTSTSTVIP